MADIASTSSLSLCNRENENWNVFEGIAPPSTTQSSAHPAYDVFINHRGTDVKKNLANIIYYYLTDVLKLRVFLDEKELEMGDDLSDTIQDAIRSARVQIAIFSKNYAQSPWCLAELCFMLETGAKLIPVFYDVEPSELRWMKEGGGYARAFKKYEEKQRYGRDTLNRWKDALHRVSFKTGAVFYNDPNAEHGRLLMSIADSVLESMDREELYVAKHPVGLDMAVEDFQNTVLGFGQARGENVRVVGIVGMGGAGKTTLAKQLYNNMSSAYKGSSCFLEDVRETATKEGLISLQSKLCDKLLHYRREIYSTSQGNFILKSRLRGVKVLIVLDDVDCRDQIDNLIIGKDIVGGGSLIIITSRDKGVLETSGVGLFYEVKGLDATNAKELFCWHAFGQPRPMKGFEDLVGRFSSACGGLPLSLKVIGALLYCSRDPRYWEGELENISKISDIKTKLKVSFDALGMEEREIFLDIACFFVGEDRNIAIRIWDGSMWSGSRGLRSLEQKCLVEFHCENEGYEKEGEERFLIKMHDQLRDLGRDIVDERSLYHPTLPKRLWRPDNISDLLQQRSGTIVNVRGIWARHTPLNQPRLSTWYKCWTDLLENCGRLNFVKGSFARGSVIELLVAQGDSVMTKYSNMTGYLLWLRWYHCPYSSIPSQLSMHKLRVLEIFGGHFETLWQSCGQAPMQLREVNISASLRNIPNSIGELKHLEKLVVTFGTLKTLPEDFCRLSKLNYLDLSNCTELQSLPDRFGELTNLQHINLLNCGNLQMLPCSFSRLIQLQYLNLQSCSNALISPDILENISTLEYLDFSWCSKLEVLPTQITRQRSLRNLYLKNTSIEVLPSEFGELSNLKVLEISSRLLRELPPSLGNLSCLKALKLLNCSSLGCIPESIGQLKCLKYLTVQDAGVEFVPQGVAYLNNLEKLEMQDCPIGDVILNSSVDHNCMFRLKSISLNATKTTRICITNDVCPGLETLKIAHLSNLINVEALPTALICLQFNTCKVLKRIGGLSHLTELRYLDISGCCEVEELECLAKVTSLEELRTDGCWKLKKIGGLEQLERLNDIQIAVDNRSIWKDIQCLQRWPSNISGITLSARTEGSNEISGVNSILDSFEFPLTMLNFSMVRRVHKDHLEIERGGMMKVKSCIALIMCFICKNSANICDKFNDYLDIFGSGGTLGYKVAANIESERMILSIFTQDSRFIQHLRRHDIGDNILVRADTPGRFETKKAWMVVFEDGEVWKIAPVWEKLFTYAHSKQPALSNHQF